MTIGEFGFAAGQGTNSGVKTSVRPKFLGLIVPLGSEPGLSFKVSEGGVPFQTATGASGSAASEANRRLARSVVFMGLSYS